ncbi:MAG: putative membrane protein [Phormidesmis priestleyi Ana]|uniref:Putative membrane protein n=1 Tax=Phormidesmis priestleyi Ana TaxID=1666911 RepID=A0A0P8DB82_9CYAN|nr:MAG: putative membrane protein [Phormidesmis priestleyi Ana]
MLAVFILIAGIAHFVVDEPFIRIVPDFLPHPAALVYISGVIEIGLAIGLLMPFAGVRSLAAWGMIALFIAVYPANLNMAFNHIKITGIPDSWWFHGIRLPFQFVLIAWAYWLTNPDETPSRSGLPVNRAHNDVDAA